MIKPLLCAAAVAWAAGMPAWAITVAESGDAGAARFNAQAVGAGTDAIAGALVDQNFHGDIDMYALVFSTGGVTGFETRTASSGSGTLADPDLYLFNAAGNPLAVSGDGDGGIAGGGSLEAGFSLFLAPGTYYVAILPVGSSVLDASFSVIADPDLGVVNPSGVLAGYRFDAAEGTYTILLSRPTDGALDGDTDGTAVPEPATAALGALAALGIGLAAAARRRFDPA